MTAIVGVEVVILIWSHNCHCSHDCLLVGVSVERLRGVMALFSELCDPVDQGFCATMSILDKVGFFMESCFGLVIVMLWLFWAKFKTAELAQQGFFFGKITIGR